MNNKEIATAFFNGQKTDDKKSFFVEVINGVSIVFSYGYHFPIAIKFNDGYLANSDGYSNTTARHKSLILNEIKNELSDNDFKTTNELKVIVDKVRYSDIRTKNEIIEAKI